MYKQGYKRKNYKQRRKIKTKPVSIYNPLNLYLFFLAIIKDI